MISIEKIDTDNKSQVRRFVRLLQRLYKDCPQWVPLINMDAYIYLNRNKHPAKTTEQMRADLKNLNGVECKNHRVYRKNI